MADPTSLSETNILNSLAGYLAGKFISAGYLVYWHTTDMLQIADSSSGCYFAFSDNREDILAEAPVVAAVAAAKGVLTVGKPLPAEPRFVTRLISDASLGPADEMPVPCLALDVSPVLYTNQYEVGSRRKWRPRHLVVDCWVRDDAEQRVFSDALFNWLEEDTHVEVLNHDDGSLDVVESVRLTQTRVDKAIYALEGGAAAFEVLTNVVVEYVA